MCTVSFIPSKDRFFITSNRDEKYTRRDALPPSIYNCGDCKLIYPKDADAGGSWIALKENGDTAVLLNGAFESHLPKPLYRKSRGLILLDVLADKNPLIALQKIDLTCIEPFTIILLEQQCLYEFRWDGNTHYCKELSVESAYIWSSATLYDKSTIRKREEWLISFIDTYTIPTQQDILRFHRFGGEGDHRNDLRMERDHIYSTVSITSILLTADRGVMEYHDLKNNKRSEIKIGLYNTAAV